MGKAKPTWLVRRHRMLETGRTLYATAGEARKRLDRARVVSGCSLITDPASAEEVNLWARMKEATLSLGYVKKMDPSGYASVIQRHGVGSCRFTALGDTPAKLMQAALEYCGIKEAER